jgi:segregation and condensation protein A
MSVKIRIEQFEGPLDLLLQLIEGQELDITSLALANVTEQFLDYVKQLQDKNPTHLADFLVIAAKLLVIKSKALLPNLELGIEEEESAYDLTQQLLVYKKYKEVAKHLRRLDLRRQQSWTREPEFSDQVAYLPDPEVTPEALAGSIRKLANELKEVIRLPQQVMAEVVSITEKIEHIQKLIADKVETSLASLIKEAKSKTEVVVTFLAVLELTKQRIVSVEQSSLFQDIMIKRT